MRLFKLSTIILATTAALYACGGGGGGEPVPVAKAPTVLAVNATTGPAVVPAVENTPITFPSGVPALGTTGSTTVSVTPPTSPTAPPQFAVSSAAGTASGDLGFGSCIFMVKTSTFPAGSPLSVGAKITVDPCTITLGTAGLPANGTSTQVTVTLTLGTSTGTGTVTASILSTGDVIVNNSDVSKVPVGSGTGS